MLVVVGRPAFSVSLLPLLNSQPSEDLGEREEREESEADHGFITLFLDSSQLISDQICMRLAGWAPSKLNLNRSKTAEFLLRKI